MVSMYFGNIGSGKTTLACYLAQKGLRRYTGGIYSNFDCKLARRVPDGMIPGDWTFPANSLFLIDEASIDFNNRKYKTLSQSFIKWVKLSRHYGVDVILFSQSWDDVDITFRRLVSQLFYIKKIGPFSLVRRVFKRVMVDDNTHQIVDGYKFSKLIFKLIPIIGLFYNNIHFIFRPKYYKYFDSFSAPYLPVKSFESSDCNVIDASPGHKSSELDTAATKTNTL